jgi:hypothetical protein
MQTKPISTYPKVVDVYKQRFDRMAEQVCILELVDYTKNVLHDTIEGLNWQQLLEWEHRHLKYTNGELSKPRAEMPVEIILQSRGRCGEFALLYNGLLLANSYMCRLIVDCSTLTNKSKKSAGDHVWNEVLVESMWLHIDPTERRIDRKAMYCSEWKKDVNLVYAISRDRTVDVTESYHGCQ